MCLPGITRSNGEPLVPLTHYGGDKLMNRRKPQTKKVSSWIIVRRDELMYSTVRTRHSVTYKHSQSETWDGDAFLRVEGNKVTMITETGDR